MCVGVRDGVVWVCVWGGFFEGVLLELMKHRAHFADPSAKFEHLLVVEGEGSVGSAFEAFLEIEGFLKLGRGELACVDQAFTEAFIFGFFGHDLAEDGWRDQALGDEQIAECGDACACVHALDDLFLFDLLAKPLEDLAVLFFEGGVSGEWLAEIGARGRCRKQQGVRRGGRRCGEVAQADQFAQDAACTQEMADIFEFEFELFGLDVVKKGSDALQQFESGAQTQQPTEFMNPRIGGLNALPKSLVMWCAFHFDELFVDVFQAVQGFILAVFEFFLRDRRSGL